MLNENKVKTATMNYVDLRVTLQRLFKKVPNSGTGSGMAAAKPI